MIQEIVCPACGKQKLKVFTPPHSSGRTVEVQQSKRVHQLVRKTGERTWTQTIENGIVVQCKCGGPFFLYGPDSEGRMEVDTHLGEGLMSPWFCEKCGRPTVTTSIGCPYCNGGVS